ncbi:uncharacterized protein Tco_0683678 [Tanacetum coccineum]
MLDQNSSITQAFRMARDWCHSHSSVNVQLRMLSERTSSKQYNAPTIAKAATLITNDFGDRDPTRDIIVNMRDGPPKRISKLHTSYMALQYPFLFPYGEDGYHDKIPYYRNTGTRKTNRGYVTMKEYYAYVIHQDTLRVDRYHNVCDAITRGDTNATGLGKRIVLPYTFIGGPRYMMQNYQDALALCRAYRNPYLFITFTSNPKCPEINEMLAHVPGQHAHDRPEVGTSVFKLKLTELLEDLTKNNIFGESRAVVYVIEFQKCSLPHAHILLWLKDHCKCRTPGEIDDIILVELPSPTDDPTRYKAVTDYMLHDPCGKDARYAPCNVEGKCYKHFPKPIYEETIIDKDGYPIYRQRDNKVTFKKGTFTFDNRYVEPHNRYLLLKYQAHINVEWCNRSKAIKYLFKYLNKGLDRATMVIQENVPDGQTVTTEKVAVVNEIKNYLNCKYLAPCEAVWRMLSFDIHYSYPFVMKLNFHLPNQQPITLRDSESLPALLEREGISITMFTDWFALNERYPTARARTYAEIPQYYMWYECLKMWKPQKQRKCIGRIVYSTPDSGERYFLQMLLNFVKGLEWTRAIQEASVWALGPQLLDLFVTILLFCDVSRPLTLWEETWEVLSKDILHWKRKLFKYPALQLTTEQIQNYCLVEIQEVLNRNGRSGTGKTFLYKTIIVRLRSEQKIVLAVASSGIASLLLPAGRTAHSRFVIPLELLENNTCGIKQNTHLAEVMQEVELVIWDEAPMTQNVAWGDFRQILPVIPKGKRSDIVQACINSSELWKHCKVFTLTRSMRVNEYYANGELDTRKQDLINGFWPSVTKDDAYLKESAILTPRNDDVDAINAYMFDKLEGESITYNSADEICKASTDTLNHQHLYPIEFLNTVNFLGMPPHALKLKKELPIMLLRNVNPSKGLCNGTRLIITELGEFFLRQKS